MSDEMRPNFEGHAERECGDHRTVGPHRAWCYDCHEWCYPEGACRGCELPGLRAENERLRDWKASAMSVLGEWDRVFMALGEPGPLGGSKAANALAEVERLRHGPLRDDEPTRCTAGEVRQIMDEAEALEAENERLREAIATHRRDTETVDQYGTADYDYDNVNADLWASLSETGGEGA